MSASEDFPSSVITLYPLELQYVFSCSNITFVSTCQPFIVLQWRIKLLPELPLVKTYLILARLYMTEKVISKNHVLNYTPLHLQEFHPSPFANILDSQLRGINYKACFDLLLFISSNSLLIILGDVSNGTHHGVCGLLSLYRVFPLPGMPHSPPVLQANSNKCAVITHLDATRDAFLVQKN